MAIRVHAIVAKPINDVKQWHSLAGRPESVLNDPEDYNRKIRQDLLIEFRGLELRSTWGLFSPREVDAGSRLLLDHLELDETADCLDLGCGYGVLGLCMARAAPQGRTLMVDKDFVAVEYAERNRRRNGIDNASCLLSNGFEQVPGQTFDVIVSNVPAKVGRELLYIYLFDALAHLKPGGAFYVVTITGLRQFFKRGFQDVFGHYEKIKQGKTYTVAELSASGEAVYKTHCVACHQPNGNGMPPTFPALTGGTISTGPIANHLDIVLNGSKKNPMMVAFGAQLSDMEVASVITYERNALGNSVGDSLQPGDVAAARK